MPRLVMILNEGEPREVEGLRVTARVIRSHGRRIRVVLDVPSKAAGGSPAENRDSPPPQDDRNVGARSRPGRDN